MVAMGNIHLYLRYGKNCITNNGDKTKFIFPIVLLVVVVVQFKSLYLINRKSETLHTYMCVYMTFGRHLTPSNFLFY